MSLYHLKTGGELATALQREWLLTNGCGAFACSTVAACNTRRYHGLLVAATLPPVGRIVALSRVQELLYFPGQDQPLELSVNQFRQRVHPRGYQYLTDFDLGHRARWQYQAGPAAVTKELALLPGHNVVCLRYTVRCDQPVELHLLPLVALRDFHHLRRGASPDMNVSSGQQQAMVTEGKYNLRLLADSGQFVPKTEWWFGHVYPVETSRGQDDTEDLMAPGRFVFPAGTDSIATLWAGTEDLSAFAPARAAPGAEAPAPQPIDVRSDDAPPPLALQRLLHAADQFIVQRRRPDGQAGASILAGYPWFSDWGRDAMIALPGLLLSTGRFERAAQVLLLFADYVSQGMIPNCFDDYSHQPHYNTVDASLWFIHASFEYARLSGDHALFETQLLPACRQIVAGYSAGTRFGIRANEDGLITAGDASTQLTWMDAKHDGVVFTPRHGKAVEINALWYNALCLLGDSRAPSVARSFRTAFWLNAFRGLYDVVQGSHRDASVRPNQIFAVSLPHSPLEADQQRAVVEVVQRELLTPVGLRSLAPSDRGYRPRYAGSAAQRDAAYHNGTVWAWLMGPFLDAYLRVHEDSPAARAQARQWLAPLLEHLDEGCIGQIAEIFDGDEPHHARGCFAQAWSVAEVLRLYKRLEQQP